MKDWKMIAVIASLAFLFSFISGLIGSVGFGIILIRAIFGTVIFAALGFGISLLLRRFLPELFEINAKTVLEAEVNSSQKQNESDELPDITGEVEGNSHIDISIGNEKEDFAVEMVQSETPGLEKSGESELVDEIEESETKLDVGQETNNIPSNIDVLPDMGEFSNSFNGLDNIGSSGGAGAATLDIMGEEHDPELVAKALRTMVKKDQEG